MKTFTVRELDRQPSSVLDFCDREGKVKIRRRDGRTYTLRADSRQSRMLEVPDFKSRAAKIFPKEIPLAQVQLVDKWMAGE